MSCLEDKIITSLYAIYGTGTSCYRIGNVNLKKVFLKNILNFKDELEKKIKFSIIHNMDYLKFIKSISFREKEGVKNTFFYCDPPYSVSKGRLEDNKYWSIHKLEELINALLEKKSFFAISEFSDEEVIKLFEKYSLTVSKVAKSSGVSATFKHEKYEILATNYLPNIEEQLDMFEKNKENK